MPRLFAAIELPQPVRDILAGLPVEIPGARRVQVDQMHLTLAFLGEVGIGTCEILKRRLDGIRAPAFELRLSEGGCFPGRRRPRVLWIGVEPEPNLALLAGLLRDEILACGITLEARPFHPHVTLARIQQGAVMDSSELLNPMRGSRFPVIPVHEFVLFESRLRHHGAEHIPLARFSLCGR